MSTQTAKRPLDLGSSPAPPDDGNATEDVKRAETKKKGSRPGRKLLDDEAKNKRTAQNRAAQRAFRERKERKMKELEEKVKDLEQMNQSSALETDFLRSQLLTLVSELKRYRPEKESDVQVLDYLARHERGEPSGDSVGSLGTVKLDADEIGANIQKKMDFTFAFPWKGRKDTDAAQFPSPGSSMVSSSSTSVNSASSTGRRRSTLRSSSDNSTTSNKNSLNLGSGTVPNQTPGSESTSTSTSGTGWMENVFYNDDARQLPQFNSTSAKNYTTEASLGYDSTQFSNHFNFDDQFDEQVSEFCSKMNQACGTKECPIPSSQNTGLTPVSVGNDSALKTKDLVSPGLLTNSWDTKPSPTFGKSSFASAGLTPTQLTNEISISDAALAYDDASKKKRDYIPFIDSALAFPNEDDEGLFFRENAEENNLFSELLDETEKNEPVDNFVNNYLINEEPTTTSRQRQDKQTPAQDPDVVPSRDGKLLKCSEVWDRITAHPKYSSIDIDGLCGELMTKAKCSEKGVVVQAEDVQSVLDNHMSSRQP